MHDFLNVFGGVSIPVTMNAPAIFKFMFTIPVSVQVMGTIRT